MEAERNITRRDRNRRNRNRNNRNRNNRNNDRMSRLSRRVGDNILSAANFASAIPRRSIRQVGRNIHSAAAIPGRISRSLRQRLSELNPQNYANLFSDFRQADNSNRMRILREMVGAPTNEHLFRILFNQGQHLCLGQNPEDYSMGRPTQFKHVFRNDADASKDEFQNDYEVDADYSIGQSIDTTCKSCFPEPVPEVDLTPDIEYENMGLVPSWRGRSKKSKKRKCKGKKRKNTVKKCRRKNPMV